MKRKIAYIVLAIIFIAAIIVTITCGLKVDLNYSEGENITFTVGKTITTDQIKEIANEIWGKNNYLVQEVELFGDSARIKVKSVTDENIEQLTNKINEKYSTELKTSDFDIEHVMNTRLRNVIEPYIVPIGIATLLILAYYAIRFRGTMKMINVLKYIIIAEGILYSVYALIRVPVNSLTMPLALIAFTMVVMIYTALSEKATEK